MESDDEISKSLLLVVGLSHCCLGQPAARRAGPTGCDPQRLPISSGSEQALAAAQTQTGRAACGPRHLSERPRTLSLILSENIGKQAGSQTRVCRAVP